ncbi:MAG: YjhX family toxin [Arenibacterium sp.]
MNISKLEQRTLHVLARGGAIHYERQTNGKIQSVTCFSREGHILSDCTIAVFDRLKKRGFIKSVHGQPYRATHRGLRAVNAQLDNR